MSATHPGMTAAERLEATVDDLAQRLNALPEANFTRRLGADDWTAAEVIGHMSEMMPYWAHAADAILQQPGHPFGRALDDPDRVGAVATANGVPRAEALARMRHAAHAAATSIRAYDEAAWQTEGAHHARGAMTVGELIAEMVVEHAESHVQQALAAAGAD
jgi:DinB superfamily